MQRSFIGVDVALIQVGRRFQEWRERHGGRGRRLPEELWNEAVRLAEGGDAPRIAKALRLRPDALASRVGQRDSAAAERAAERRFVEVTPIETPAARRSGSGCRVEISNGGTRTVVLHLADADGVDLVALAHGLLEERS